MGNSPRKEGEGPASDLSPPPDNPNNLPPLKYSQDPFYYEDPPPNAPLSLTINGPPSLSLSSSSSESGSSASGSSDSLDSDPSSQSQSNSSSRNSLPPPPAPSFVSPPLPPLPTTPPISPSSTSLSLSLSLCSSSSFSSTSFLSPSGAFQLTNSNEASQQPVSQPRIPTIFTWQYGGETVQLTGSWNNWSLRIPLHKSEDEFTLICGLVPGTYQYKFIVDGRWEFDPKQPLVTDPIGNVNNVITVELPPKVRSLHRFGDSPPGSYGAFPVSENFLNEDPQPLPVHLHQILLNTEYDSTDPTLLPTPQHIMLNRFYIYNNLAAGRDPSDDQSSSPHNLHHHHRHHHKGSPQLSPLNESPIPSEPDHSSYDSKNPNNGNRPQSRRVSEQDPHIPLDDETLNLFRMEPLLSPLSSSPLSAASPINPGARIGTPGGQGIIPPSSAAVQVPTTNRPRLNEQQLYGVSPADEYRRHFELSENSLRPSRVQVVGLTQRFRRKYVTLIFYKPLPEENGV